MNPQDFTQENFQRIKESSCPGTSTTNPVCSKESRGGNLLESCSDRLEAQSYLNEKKIFDLFKFLIGHLLVDEPSDPVEYLVDLLDRCILFRSGLAEPPLLFTNRHVESIFQSMDPSGLGTISLEQYKAGMTTLGISQYESEPMGHQEGRVNKEIFVGEARKCLVRMLVELIGKTA
ncbi:uncharacterized protein LOC107264646 [Cephus cinctus]|uniref:Uncharacterized protein LOC107264646 n=1 Tax=Cephus cinctus TaxID=211228 RepID=A0AAJ7VY92_CEPCN|nr:uncharacterized protein LOC107264646 [Cephus cinctus]XP_024937624.1 uncharacterized protein LOC107264646 [Cephus cinctus]